MDMTAIVEQDQRSINVIDMLTFKPLRLSMRLTKPKIFQ